MVKFGNEGLNFSIYIRRYGEKLRLNYFRIKIVGMEFGMLLLIRKEREGCYCECIEIGLKKLMK